LYFGTNWVSPTTRVYWTLDYLGLGDRTSILNGGLVAWEATHHAVSTEIKQSAKVRSRRRRARKSWPMRSG